MDVFGRIRNEVKAARANVHAEEEDRHDVLVVLLGEVARSYADLRGFQLRLDIAEKNIQTQEDTVHLTQARAQNSRPRTLWSQHCEAPLRLRFTA
jgi:outer membrane protein, multidrug efflux system